MSTIYLSYTSTLIRGSQVSWEAERGNKGIYLSCICSYLDQGGAGVIRGVEEF